jgi:hypothetical protein
MPMVSEYFLLLKQRFSEMSHTKSTTTTTLVVIVLNNKDMRGGDKDGAGQDYGEGGEGQQAQPVQYLHTKFKFNILFQFLQLYLL